MARIFGSVCPFPHISHIYTTVSPQPLRPTTEISRLLCSSVVANSKICRGRSRNSSVVESQGYFVLERPFLQFHEQQAKFANEVNHLTRFFEKVDSQLPSRLMMLIRQPLKMKNLQNLPKIADTPYLSLYCNSTKQNDNVTMTFPVNPSLQCFRTAALSMVTLNMESRNPMGRVYAENRSKTQKLLGVKGLKLHENHSLPCR